MRRTKIAGVKYSTNRQVHIKSIHPGGIYSDAELLTVLCYINLGYIKRDEEKIKRERGKRKTD